MANSKSRCIRANPKVVEHNTSPLPTHLSKLRHSYSQQLAHLILLLIPSATHFSPTFMYENNTHRKPIPPSVSTQQTPFGIPLHWPSVPLTALSTLTRLCLTC